MTPGPVTSLVVGDNSDLIAEAARLYLPDGGAGKFVADVTWGKGVFWRKFQPETLLASDLLDVRDHVPEDVKFEQADYRELPYAADSIDVLVLDPPYIHSPGKHTTDSRYNNAETTGLLADGSMGGRYWADIRKSYAAGMAEAWRVLHERGQLWVKCMDQVQASVQQWGHIDLYQDARELGFIGRDLFILAPPSSTPRGRWKIQNHARKKHSYLWVFDKPVPKKSRKPKTVK